VAEEEVITAAPLDAVVLPLPLPKSAGRHLRPLTDSESEPISGGA